MKNHTVIGTSPTATSRHRSAPPPLRWLAVGAGLGAIVATYWDGAWHTEIGRDSTFAPPHVLLYASITLAALLVGTWALTTMVRERSVLSVFRNPVLVLSGVALTAVAASAVLDVLWHEYFGRDAVLWSPPHLLGIIGSVVLVVALTISGDRDRPPGIVDIALGAVLLGTSMLPVMEYDSRVPQFPEVLYLPIVILVAFFAAWVITVSAQGARVITLIVVSVVALRTGIWGALMAVGWPAVDVPFALLGLAVLDLHRLRTVHRVALAAIAMSVIQLAASAAGLSSVQLEQVLPGAVGVVVIAGAWMLAARRTPGLQAALVVLGLAAASVTLDTLPARAHDPGQGADRGQIEMTVDRVDSRVMVTVDVVSASLPLRFERIVARRAGEIIEASAVQRDESGTVTTGSLDLDDKNLWFIYAEFSSSVGILESWITVQPGESRTDVRPLYEPPVSPVNDLEFVLASAALYGLAGLLVWGAIRVVRGSRATPAGRPSA